MKSEHNPRLLTVCLGLVLLVLVAGTLGCGSPSEGQAVVLLSGSAPESISQLFDRLQADGVVIKDGGALTPDGTAAFVTLQSDPSYPSGSAQDFVDYLTVEHDAAILSSQGSALKTIRVRLLSPSGDTLRGQEVGLTVGNWVTRTDWTAEAEATDEDVTSDITAVVEAAPIDSALKLQAVTLSRGWSGERVLSIDLTTDDPTVCWHPLDVLRAAVCYEVNKLNNDGGALVALVHINVDTPEGKPIHRSWLDFEFRMDSYWNDVSIPEAMQGGLLGGAPVGFD